MMKNLCLILAITFTFSPSSYGGGKGGVFCIYSPSLDSESSLWIDLAIKKVGVEFNDHSHTVGDIVFEALETKHSGKLRMFAKGTSPEGVKVSFEWPERVDVVATFKEEVLSEKNKAVLNTPYGVVGCGLNIN